MKRSDEQSRLDAEVVGLIGELEAALVEYVEKFGLTERARRALRTSAVWHAVPTVDQIMEG
jgi:hypothetical protein